MREEEHHREFIPTHKKQGTAFK